MANVAAVVLDIERGSYSGRRVLWEAMGNGDVGIGIATSELLENFGFADRSVQVVSGGGSGFNGGTCTIQGSNDGTTWATLHDPWMNNLAFTATDLKQIMEICLYIRPSNSATAGMDVDVYLVAVEPR